MGEYLMDMKEFAHITITKAEKAAEDKDFLEAIRLLQLLIEAVNKQINELARGL